MNRNLARIKPYYYYYCYYSLKLILQAFVLKLEITKKKLTQNNIRMLKLNLNSSTTYHKMFFAPIAMFTSRFF